MTGDGMVYLLKNAISLRACWLRCQQEWRGTSFSINALFQINASAFIEKSTRRKILDFFANDAAHVIGSDMHNLTTRAPNLAEAYAVIEKKFGWEYVDFLQQNSTRIVVNKKTLPTGLPKLNIIKKLFI